MWAWMADDDAGSVRSGGSSKRSAASSRKSGDGASHLSEGGEQASAEQAKKKSVATPARLALLDNVSIPSIPPLASVWC